MERMVATESSLMKKTKKDLSAIILKNDKLINELQEQHSVLCERTAALDEKLDEAQKAILSKDLAYDKLLNEHRKLNNCCKIYAFIAIALGLVLGYILYM